MSPTVAELAVTVHELLLVQRWHAAGGDKPGTFSGIRDRERPSQATLSLILHWRHFSLRGPVHSIHECWPTYSWVPKCCRPLNALLSLYPVYRGTTSQVVKSANSLTFILQERFWAFMLGVKSTWPLKIWKRVFSSLIPLCTLPQVVLSWSHNRS